MDYLDKLEEERAAAADRAAAVPALPVGSPGALQYAVPQPASPVRAIGLAQRRIMWVILATFLLMFSVGVLGAGGSLVATPQGALAIRAVLTLAQLAVLALMMIGIYQMAAALGAPTSTRVLYIIAMLIPCVSLIVLLVVNRQATTMLRRNGVKVGLMGARLRDLPAS